MLQFVFILNKFINYAFLIYFVHLLFFLINVLIVKHITFMVLYIKNLKINPLYISLLLFASFISSYAQSLYTSEKVYVQTDKDY